MDEQDVLDETLYLLNTCTTFLGPLFDNSFRNADMTQLPDNGHVPNLLVSHPQADMVTH